MAEVVLGLSVEGFVERLQSGKSVHCTYEIGALAGLISAWQFEQRFIVTWEECPIGSQFDESTYTRDERFEFNSAAEVLLFVEKHGHQAAMFTP